VPAASACRDLVAVRPMTGLQGPAGLSRRPSAAFLAQLIATATHAPQTRERRRVAPGEAARSYVATAAALSARRCVQSHSA
jgi:hypothetical protein